MCKRAEDDRRWRERRGVGEDATGFTHTGVKYRLPSVAWVAWIRDTREEGRRKGVDKVAIAHGTQLHAPAPVPTNSPVYPDRPPSALPPPHRAPSRAHPTAFPASPLNPRGSLSLCLSLSHPLFPPPVSGFPLGITKRTTPLDSKREISQTTRWQRCSCRELLVLGASTNLRGNPSRRSPSRATRGPHLTPSVAFSTRLFPPLVLSSSFLPCARNPANRRQSSAA